MNKPKSSIVNGVSLCKGLLQNKKRELVGEKLRDVHHSKEFQKTDRWDSGIGT